MAIIIPETSDLLSARQRQITSEMHALKARLSSLSTEAKEIAVAEAVLTRFGTDAETAIGKASRIDDQTAHNKPISKYEPFKP